MTKDLLNQIITKNLTKKILVAGDVMVDEYIYGTVSRICPEAPVAVLKAMKKHLLPGGAANVACLLTCLSLPTRIMGCLHSNDYPGKFLQGFLNKSGVEQLCINYPAGETIVKQRLMSQNQMLLRIDYENCQNLGDSLSQQAMAYLSQVENDTSLIILSDYAKGFLSDQLVTNIIAWSRNRGISVVVDPKGNDYTKYLGATLLTPNRNEVALAVGKRINNLEELVEAGYQLLKRTENQALIITNGAEGVLVLERDGVFYHLPALSCSHPNVIGAGDAFIAGLTLGISSEAGLLEAACLGIYTAGLAVRKTVSRYPLLSEIVYLLKTQPFTIKQYFKVI
ncbi:MAG: bifunctional ADP-heptose synthase [Clostridia bacterium]|nr:bifunctional ADP-heptose synthase [Clostridia bacterium]